jgi:aminoglycoside/choline kinase family phosphotransferase
MSDIKKNISRIDEIHQWLKTIFPSTNYVMEAASNDASFRRYFRITEQANTLILMDAPPAQEDIDSFIDIGIFLHEQGIHVPKIYARNTTLGFLLLSDFGHQSYLDQLNEHSADTLYKAAIDSLIKMQLCSTQGINIPLYNKALLQQEMTMFPDWFLDKHLNIEPPAFLTATFDDLTTSALAQPQVFVHRDYHSRNLMHTTNNSPGIIDFQDAVIGGITYDLVSLLRDCYIAWPDQKINHWLEYYFTSAQLQGLLADVSIEQFRQWFDWMGLQRHIKILGIFCRLNYRDNKANYMNDLPLTLQYIRKISAQYPEFSELNHFLQQQPKIVAI